MGLRAYKCESGNLYIEVIVVFGRFWGIMDSFGKGFEYGWLLASGSEELERSGG
jgi:hypothetical protein